MKKMKKGFTLVEIMIVVAIIAILAAVAIPNFIKYRKTSQMNACISNMKQIQGAAEQAKLAGKSVTDEEVMYGAKGYIKTKPKCPEKGTDYTVTESQDGEVTITCSGGDTDYPHKLPEDNSTSGGSGGSTGG